MAQDDFLNFSERVKQAESRGRRFDEKNRLLTSPKGAQGEMQVMPKTQRDPGYGVTPARDKSPEEIARVGRDYLRAMLDRYGDEKLAAIAYNWGPKNADKWVAAGSDFSKLPKETRDYVNRVMGGTAPVEAKAPVVEPVETAPTLGYSAKASVPTEAVSRETMAKAPAISEGAQAKLASLGPSYQAALALSMLSDEGEKKDIDSEPSIAEKWLAETASGPSALAGLEDIKIRSPFIQPVMMAGGGEVDAYADPNLQNKALLRSGVTGGLAPVPGGGGSESGNSSGSSGIGQGISDAATSIGLGLMGYGEMGLAPGSMAASAIGSALAGSQADAMGHAADALGAISGLHGLGSFSDANGNIGSFSNDASIAAADAAAFGDSGFGFGADGADAGADAGSDGGDGGDGGAWSDGGEVSFDELPAKEQLRFFKHGMSGKGPSGEDVQSFIAGAELPVGDSGGVSLAGNLSKMSMDQKENLARSMLASLYYKVGDGELRANVIKPMDAGAEDVLMTSFGGSYPVGQGRASVYRNMLSAPGYQGPTGYSVGYGGQVGPGFLSGGAMIPEQGSPQWQLRYQIPVGRAEGSPEQGEVTAPTAEELEAASKPAFLTPKSGIGRKISTKPGEIEGAVLQGVSELPYNLFGAAADIPAMLMRPFGYDVKAPVFSSDWLKEKASQFGVRQEPPTDPTTKAFYEIGQVGSSLINPAAPVRGAVAAAQKTGEAAKMLARDFQEYNRALAVPGASYAVRMPGEPFSLEKSTHNPWAYVQGAEDLSKKFSTTVDAATNYVRELANTNDDALNNWITQKLGMYMRRDMGTEADPFVKAAEEGRQLHFAPKPTKRDPDPTRRMREDFEIFPEGMAYMREQSGFPPRGFAKTPYGQQVEMITDASVWPTEKQNFNITQVPEFMKNMPPETRLMQLGAIEALQLETLRDKMSTMRQMAEGPGFSAYGQSPIKIPDRYKLDDKTLLGLTPDQASERVAQFDAWKETNRQHMASQSALKDPNLNRVELPGGVTAVQLPDLKSSPNAMQLAKDMGCDGGWCTNLEINALDYGSGDNRLHILVDKKARPVAQITLTRLPPSKKQLLDDPSAGDRFSITELLARDNTDNFQNLQALSDIQQYVKTLDRQYGLRFVSNLDKIGMTEIPPLSIVWGTNQLSKLRRQQLPANISLTDYEASLKRDAIDFENALYDINGGSKYVIKDQIDSLIHDALVRLAPPQPEAVLPKPKKLSTGGMIERNTVDNRTYM